MADKIKFTNKLSDSFFNSVLSHVGQCRHRRKCPKHSDEEFTEILMRRTLQPVDSGRDFLQAIHAAGNESWSLTNFFDALKSPRRLKVLREVLDRQVRKYKDRPAPGWIEDCPELDDFDLLAGDGTFFAAACHTDMLCDKKRPVCDIFALNLRSGLMDHLCCAQPKPGNVKAHEMTALREVGAKGLRHHVPKGKKLLFIYDRACINEDVWRRWKTQGVYVLTREKANMVNDLCGICNWDREDPRNIGVQSDVLVFGSAGVPRRRIEYRDPSSDELYVFITNQITLPPGVLAWTYRRRWDIEKAYDVVKRKLRERKNWGTTMVAREMQSIALCLVLNAMLLVEDQVRSRGLIDHKEVKRRKQREAEATRKTGLPRTKLPAFFKWHSVPSQLSFKFIRWLRSIIDLQITEDEALAKLNFVYRNL